MPIIFCINITTVGERYIAKILLSENYAISETQAIANAYKDDYDEVYIMNFDTSCDDIINEIVLKGCRM